MSEDLTNEFLQRMETEKQEIEAEKIFNNLNQKYKQYNCNNDKLVLFMLSDILLQLDYLKKEITELKVKIK